MPGAAPRRTFQRFPPAGSHARGRVADGRRCRLFVLSRPATGRHAFKDKTHLAVILSAEIVPDLFEE